MLALDIGSGNTKAVVRVSPEPNALQTGVVPTAAGRIPEDRLDDFVGTELRPVKIGDEHWIVGDQAVGVLDPRDRECSLSDDWAGSDAWMAILYHVIANYYPDGGRINLALATGIPQELYRKVRPGLMARLDGEHRFEYGGQAYEVAIQPYLVPQATAALIFQASQDGSVLDCRSGVLDVGTHTTGISVLEQDQFVMWLSGGISVGAGAVAEKLNDHLQKIYHLPPQPMNNLARILLTREFMYQGKTISLNKEITAYTAEVAGPILERIAEIWGGSYGSDQRVFLAGGGAPLFLDALRTHIPHIEVVDDPLYAVAKGLMCYLDSRFRDGDDG